MANFKAGDLAVLMPNGVTVEVLEALGNPQFVHWRGLVLANSRRDQAFVVKFISGPIRNCVGDSMHLGPVSARRLMPLRGDEQPAQQRKQEQPA
jgi:hypothetical protein